MSCGTTMDYQKFQSFVANQTLVKSISCSIIPVLILKVFQNVWLGAKLPGQNKVES